MTTQPGDNLTVFRVDGDFDACQTSVKAVFDDGDFAAELAARHGLALSSANSINWGRLHAADRLLRERLRRHGRRRRICAAATRSTSACPPATSATSSPPTTRKRMGVPIGRLLCASNTNNVLTDFIDTGVYDISARGLVKTPSPSMDILISSNLERLLFDLARRRGASSAAG